MLNSRRLTERIRVDLINGAFVRPEGSNSLVYERSLALLGSDALLSSTVQSVTQSPTGLDLTIKQGATSHLIHAKRVLYAAPPSLNNLSPFALDSKQTSVFSKWTEGAEYIGVAKIPCIPENTSVTYIPSTAIPSNQLALKDYPYSLRLDSTGPTGLSLFRVVFGANFAVKDQDFQNLVIADVEKLQDAGTIVSSNNETCTTEFKATSNHTRPLWKLSAEEMREGFVQDLYALQGYRGVWYTGYAWAAPYSSTIWAFTDTVLEKLVGDLKGGE